MIIYVDLSVPVLALLSILTSIIVVNVTAFPTAKLLQERMTLSDPSPGVLQLHRRGNEGGPLTRLGSQKAHQYLDLLTATFLNENSGKLLTQVMDAVRHSKDEQVAHKATLLSDSRLSLDKHRLALLQQLHTISSAHEGVPQSQAPGLAQVHDTNSKPDIRSKAAELCYTRDSPARKTVDALTKTLQELQGMSKGIVTGVDTSSLESEAANCIQYLEDLCKTVIPGYHDLYRSTPPARPNIKPDPDQQMKGSASPPPRRLSEVPWHTSTDPDYIHRSTPPVKQESQERSASRERRLSDLTFHWSPSPQART